MEALGHELSLLLETHSEPMMEAMGESSVSKLKFEIKTKIDLSHKAHQFEDLSLSFEPVVLKRRDKKSVIGEDLDQMKLNLQGAPGVPPEKPKETKPDKQDKPEKPEKPKAETKTDARPKKSDEPKEPAKKAAAKKDDEEEDEWGKPAKKR